MVLIVASASPPVNRPLPTASPHEPHMGEPKDHAMPRASQQSADSDVALFLAEVSRVFAGPEFYEQVDYNEELQKYGKRVFRRLPL